jgi:hypothetical protein
MRPLVLCIAALGICCATSRAAPERQTAGAAPDPVRSSPTPATPVEAAAEFALTTYVDESTRAQGVVCVELDGAEDPAKVLDRLSPLASRLSAGRKECLDRAEPSAILSIGTPQVAGDRARVDVGVVLGSAGMLELERHQGSWVVVRATSPWLSLR